MFYTRGHNRCKSPAPGLLILLDGQALATRHILGTVMASYMTGMVLCLLSFRLYFASFVTYYIPSYQYLAISIKHLHNYCYY